MPIPHFRTFRYILLCLALCALFLLMLLLPGPVLRGATDGLLLWFNVVLPTLFPFILICDLLLYTGAFDLLVRLASPALCRLFGVSPQGSFAVLAGFLCGCPMGAKVTADLYREGLISRREGIYLLSFCNNTSPMFVISFLVMQNLKAPGLTVPALVTLFLAPLCVSLAMRAAGRGVPAGLRHGSDPHPLLKGTRSRKRRPFAEALDASAEDALGAITRVGAYIIAFSVLAELVRLPACLPEALRLALVSSLEVTGGVRALCASVSDRPAAFVSSLALTAFGGFCAAAQTKSMLRGTDLPAAGYLMKKLAASLAASLFAFMYLYLSGV